MPPPAGIPPRALQGVRAGALSVDDDDRVSIPPGQQPCTKQVAPPCQLSRAVCRPPNPAHNASPLKGPFSLPQAVGPLFKGTQRTPVHSYLQDTCALIARDPQKVLAINPERGPRRVGRRRHPPCPPSRALPRPCTRIACTRPCTRPCTPAPACAPVRTPACAPASVLEGG